MREISSKEQGMSVAYLTVGLLFYIWSVDGFRRKSQTKNNPKKEDNFQNEEDPKN